MQWLVDLAHKQGVMPVEPVGSVLGTFREGRLAMGVMEVNNLFLIPRSSVQGGARFKWDVQQLPAMEKGRYLPRPRIRLRGGPQLQEPELAWELLKQVVGPAGQTDWYRHARFAPSIKSLLGGAYLQEKDTPTNKKAIVDSLLAGEADAQVPPLVGDRPGDHHQVPGPHPGRGGLGQRGSVRPRPAAQRRPAAPLAGGATNPEAPLTCR